jgi:hypothetical protein
LVNIQQAC